MSNSLRVCEERGEKVLLHKCTSMRPRLKIKLSHIPLLQSVKISTWPSELLNWTETLHLLETHRQSRIYTQPLDFSLFVISHFSNIYQLCGKLNSLFTICIRDERNRQFRYYIALKKTVHPKINIIITSSPSCHSNQIWISFFCEQQSIMSWLFILQNSLRHILGTEFKYKKVQMRFKSYSGEEDCE